MVKPIGIKIGSKYTVIYWSGMDEAIRLPTCVVKIKDELRDEWEFRYGTDAEDYPNHQYPVLHGMAQSGENAELLTKFLHHIKETYKVPKNSFIVFCYPAMRASQAEEFKKMVKSLDWGKAEGLKVGIVFSYEALCGAIDAIGDVDETRKLPAVSVINCGSSTLECITFQNNKVIGGETGHGMRTFPFGGSGIDEKIATLCNEQANGAEISSTEAREWKEDLADLTDIGNPKPFTKLVFIRHKSGTEDVTFPVGESNHPIIEAYNAYKDELISSYDKYLGELRTDDNTVVNAIMKGRGKVVVTGGVANTPGFAKWITSHIKNKFGSDVEVIVSEDGVTGPAKGAHTLADHIVNIEK